MYYRKRKNSKLFYTQGMILPAYSHWSFEISFDEKSSSYHTTLQGLLAEVLINHNAREIDLLHFFILLIHIIIVG